MIHRHVVGKELFVTIPWILIQIFLLTAHRQLCLMLFTDIADIIPLITVGVGIISGTAERPNDCVSFRILQDVCGPTRRAVKNKIRFVEKVSFESGMETEISKYQFK